MNEKTTMQQLIDYIDLLDQKGLPEYTLAIAIRLKAIELLEEEKEQLRQMYLFWPKTYSSLSMQPMSDKMDIFYNDSFDDLFSFKYKKNNYEKDTL